MKIQSVALVENEEEQSLPPIEGFYQYLVAGNGLFIRAEDDNLAAVVQICETWLNGLESVVAKMWLKHARVPGELLHVLYLDAHMHSPIERMYQFLFMDKWKLYQCGEASASESHVNYFNIPNASIDIHSHGSMTAFFSDIDDADEKGLRIYCVVGLVDTPEPEIACRVGVYGHWMAVPATAIFDDISPFKDVGLNEEIQ